MQELDLYKPIPVIAYERHETIVFPSIADAAVAYNLNKKIICDRIEDGRTLEDGYTTLDWYSPTAHTRMMFDEMKEIVKKKCEELKD